MPIAEPGDDKSLALNMLWRAAWHLRKFRRRMSSKHPQFTPIEKRAAGRRFFAFFGIGLIVYSVTTICMGRLFFRNYWGGSVFAPFAIVVGILAVIIYLKNRPTRKQH
jgi:hypothetical protein